MDTDTSTISYTDDDISRMTAEGYIIIHKALWDYLPIGSHIRYMRKDTGEGLPRGQRFRCGGYIKGHRTKASGVKTIMLGKFPNYSKDQLIYSVALESIEVLWKQYDKFAFVEIHLIYNSLAQKKRQIEDLTARVEKLERRLK